MLAIPPSNSGGKYKKRKTPHIAELQHHAKAKFISYCNHAAAALKAAGAVMELPKELCIHPPPWFMLYDSGANMHVLLDSILLAYGFESHAYMGWGGKGKSDRCILRGQLWGVTWIRMSGTWMKTIIHSGHLNVWCLQQLVCYSQVYKLDSKAIRQWSMGLHLVF